MAVLLAASKRNVDDLRSKSRLYHQEKVQRTNEPRSHETRKSPFDCLEKRGGRESGKLNLLVQLLWEERTTGFRIVPDIARN